MRVEKWISDQQNQVLLRQLSRNALSELAPEEVPLFDELYLQYVEAAQSGDVTLEGERGGAFSLSGDATLLLSIVVPVLAGTLAAWAISHSLNNTADSQAGHRQDQTWPDKENVRAEINGLLPRSLPTSASRQKVLEVLTTIVIEYLK